MRIDVIKTELVSIYLTLVLVCIPVWEHDPRLTKNPVFLSLEPPISCAAWHTKGASCSRTRGLVLGSGAMLEPCPVAMMRFGVFGGTYFVIWG